MESLKYPFDPNLVLKNKKSIKNSLINDGSRRIKKNIAVLCGSTADHIISMLELFLLDAGIEPTFYKSEYGQYWQAAMFKNDELKAFAPDIIFIHTSARNIEPHFPDMKASTEDAEMLLKSCAENFILMWDRLADEYNCPIIQNNFEMPYFRLLGNRDASDVRGRANFLTRLNLKFYEYASSRSNFYINDINYLSSVYGLSEWSAPIYWYMYKYALCVPAIPEFAFNLANIIKSIFGKNKKVLALDLDNTLWGGVVGDDGPEGLEIGQETPSGQAFYELQRYIKAHKDMGIVLAICSKNDESNALAGLNHPDCALRPDDFAVIKANWDNKADNILQIAAELNILPESIVFVDDNPAEREIARAFLPNCAVLEWDGIERAVELMSRSGFFELTSFSEDDIKRNEMYKANILRAQQAKRFGNYRDYLLSLEMKAVIRDFEPLYLQRIAQLTNKSNQFNVTTKRYTEPEMKALSEDPSYIRLYGRLIDKFGDNGVTSVVIGKIDGAALHIELWLMSCRVLKRDMELAMLDRLVSECAARGIAEIRGYYYPTAKNSMVKELFKSFGFIQLSDNGGDTAWSLSIEGYENKNSVIEIE